jgi:hypothetical protein
VSPYRQLYPIYELTDADLETLDLTDGDVADWREVVGGPTLQGSRDFYGETGWDSGMVVEPYDSSDGDWQIWLAWSRHGKLYLAIERTDDDYVNTYVGGDLSRVWENDCLEFMVDGDHSGGEYHFLPQFPSDCCASEEEYTLNNNLQAQQYWSIAQTPDGVHVGYLGAGAAWVNRPPWSWGGGGVRDGVTVTEFYVTPFDSLVYFSAEKSRPSTLRPGQIIGFDVGIWEYDSDASAHVLSMYLGTVDTWRWASHFVDGVLVSGKGTTSALTDLSWGRIKASSR